MTTRDYEFGHDMGVYRRDNPDYDPRHDFADAAKLGRQPFADFKRGFEDGFDAKEPAP